MPFDKTLYPTNWDSEIRPRILARAKNCCERCGVANRAIIWRHPHEDCPNIYTLDPLHASLWYEEYPNHAVEIVLTIAHIHDPNPMNCEDANLQALCQSCHLRHDAKMHAMNVVRNKNKALEAAGQLRLFE